MKHDSTEPSQEIAADFLDLSKSLEQSPVDEHLPIYEGLINDLKVDLDF